MKTIYLKNEYPSKATSQLPFNNHTRTDRNQFRILLVYPNLPLMLVPPLAIGIFTKILQDQGYQVDLFETTAYLSDDTNISPENRVKFLQARSFDYEEDLGVEIKTSNMYEDFRKKVDEYLPHLLIFSVVEDAFFQAINLLQSIEDLNIPHILGGVFPTAAPERCMKEAVVKMIGIGEGEEIVVQVAEAIRNGGLYDSIPGTWLKYKNGNIKKNPRGELINIDTQVADFSLFDERRFYRPMGGRIFKTIPVETYRGCPYKCTYCNSPMQLDMADDAGIGDYLRRKPINHLRNEIALLVKKYNPEFLYFVDDSFLARPKSEIMKFCDMYEEFQIPFWFNTRPENCKLAEMKRLKEVGAYRISFGIECGNEQYRKNILLRQQTNKQLIDSFRIIAESQIPFSVNLIIGFPGETRDLVMDTVELVRQISGYDSLTVSIFTPYHGTKLREVAVKNGWLHSETITKHTTSSSLLKMPPPNLCASEIDSLMKVIPFYCYFPKDMWPEIALAELENEVGKQTYEKFSHIYRNEFLGENQDNKMIHMEQKLQHGTGCRSNSKDEYTFTLNRLDSSILDILRP